VELLEEKIRREGKIFEGDVLKVDGFVNHRIDVAFMSEMGKELARRFAGESVTKILTIEASGIGVACVAALQFPGVPPVVFAKKSASKNMSGDVYASEVFSYTRGRKYDIMVSKEHLSADDKVLIIDDFLAKGSALPSLIHVCEQAGAQIVGAGILIEKAYQCGGDLVRKEKGIRVESLARIASMDPQKGIEFC